MNSTEIKNTLRICGVDVELAWEDPKNWASSGMGRSSQIDSKISLRLGMNPDIEGSVLLHEVIHMIADMNGLGCLLENHVAVSVLANFLYAFLKDNKLKYWK